MKNTLQRLINVSLLLGLFAVIFVTFIVRPWGQRATPHISGAHFELTELISLSPDEGVSQSESAKDPVGGKFAVEVRRPAGPPPVHLDQMDPLGRSATATCATCHSVRPADLENRTPDKLDEFHQGLTFAHGKLACYACHHPANMDSLRLADGTVLPYQDVMELCSQCHGPQATAYAHGAHGGMTGYWDLSRGPQQRNNCIDCHDPHAPSYPKMIPTFKPRDRFLPDASVLPDASGLHSSTSNHRAELHDTP